MDTLQGKQLFIGNLPFIVGWQDLKDMFREAGEIVRADVAINQLGRSRGFGTVLYLTSEDAQSAIEKFNGFEWDSRCIEVRLDQKPEYSQRNSGAVGGGADSAQRSLYVGNLPYSVGWQDLKDLFREAGEVGRADVPLDHNNRSKGYGTVVMGSFEDAQNAIALYDGYDLQGRKIEVRADNNPSFGGCNAAAVHSSVDGQQGAPHQQRTHQQHHSAESTRGPTLPGTQLFIGNLPFNVGWQDVKDLFKQTGNVNHADVVMDYQGRSRGFGQVVMASAEEAEKAIEQLNGTDFNGRTIEVRVDKYAGEKGTSPDTSCQVFVSNLPYSTRWQELKDLFRNYNMTPTHSDIMLDQNGRSKGCGIVVLSDAQEAQRAIVEVNGAQFEGRPIIVRFDKFA